MSCARLLLLACGPSGSQRGGRILPHGLWQKPRSMYWSACPLPCMCLVFVSQLVHMKEVQSPARGRNVSGCAFSHALASSHPTKLEPVNRDLRIEMHQYFGLLIASSGSARGGVGSRGETSKMTYLGTGESSSAGMPLVRGSKKRSAKAPVSAAERNLTTPHCQWLPQTNGRGAILSWRTI